MIPKAIPMEIRHIVFLLVFFILYVIFGGGIFMILESPEEQIKRKEIQSLINEFTDHINRLNNTKFTEKNFRIILHELLVAQDNNLIDSYGNQQAYFNWSFINSFFFAITVITTIGYGHLTPSTIFGKIFCIIYALFGIPITSLLIGSVADRFSKLYSPEKMNNGLSRRRHYQRQLSARLLMLKKGLISLVPWFFAFLIVPAMIFCHFERWSFLDGFYYCFITLSTIGFGDFVAGSFEKNYVWIYKILVVFWIIFGVAYLSMVLNFITNSLRSRSISNVVQTLRLKINSNGSFVSRMRRHQEDHCHPNRYKRQQSSPVVIFNTHDHGKILTNNLNNNFIHILNENSIDTHSMTSESKASSHYTSVTMVQPLNNDTKTNESKKSFWNCLKYFKSKSKVQPNNNMEPIVKNPNKSSLRCAFEEQQVIRQTNSLPDMTEVECIDPCCSMNLDHHHHHHHHQKFPKITIV